MLIEICIANAVPGLPREQLEKAILHIRQTMREVCRRIGEPVALQETLPLDADTLVFCVQSLFSDIREEYLYHFSSSEVCPFSATGSHPDVRSSIRYLLQEGIAGMPRGF